MARSRGGVAPRRPTAAAPARKPAAPAPAPQRHSSTAAAPAPAAAAPAPQQAVSQGPGLFGQMASTAAGVAVGSTIGHALGGMFSGGGSSEAAAPAAQSTEFAQQHQTNYAQQSGSGACQADIQNFRKCMDDNQGSLSICGWYMDQLKACQAAAGQY
ncbi:hypothetical protein K504DRAFT_534024 [Pleomassaria siparia CBS 279.74]|uniref:CHCH domain-containing protein n=1 Tax=Pleomassaria siparia CBS 279.74 TaxID=1314801 RepID=A0A6G1K9X4_9PLEO|nr:hypothetical protein K504DRAFT_534024 [Pleomassaria siparia CBS 279.74]